MGNGCFKKKYKQLRYNDYNLEQIIIEDTGTCEICDGKNVLGYTVNSVIEGVLIFVCKNCKT
jgi:hypothetical protein